MYLTEAALSLPRVLESNPRRLVASPVSLAFSSDSCQLEASSQRAWQRAALVEKWGRATWGQRGGLRLSRKYCWEFWNWDCS